MLKKFGAWMDGKLRRLNWVDIKLVKWSAAAFILMIAKLWPPLLSLDWYWYGLLGLLFMARPLYKGILK